MSTQQDIANFLQAEYGFDDSHPGPEGLARIIRERRQATGRETIADYFSYLRESPEERHELFECLSVPETYFFRYPESFHALVLWARGYPRRPLRILSIACSTAEEPYSIAMTLLDAGFSTADFSIEGFDLSAKAVAAGRTGIYTSKSFRTDGAWKDRHFVPHREGLKIRNDVRETVHLHKANIWQMKTGRRWDAIFCRNVIIYFSAEKQVRLIALLGEALAEDGLLFLGSAEPALFLNYGWRPSEFPMSFSCRRLSANPPRPVRGKAQSPHAAKPKLFPQRKTKLAPARRANPPEQSAIAKARDFADRGELAAARAVLNDLLKREPGNVEAHYFSGVVAEAEKRDDLAESHYRKALYLSPEHREALQHMALLLKRHGRKQAAENLLRRAQRHSLS